MKNLFLSILVLIAAGIFVAGILIVRKGSDHKLELAQLQLEIDRQSNAMHEAEVKQKRTEQERDQIAQLADEIGAKLVAQKTSAAQNLSITSVVSAGSTAGSGSNEQSGLGKMLAKMMKDPETKQFIRQQQRLMVDQLYAPLLARLNLNETETAQLKELLAEDAMKSTERSSELLSASAQERPERMRAFTEEQKQFDQQIRSFLGESKYTTYKEYQGTLGDRAQLTLFRQQTAGTPNSITDEQAEQLLAIIREEKQAMPPLPGQEPGMEELQALASPEKLDAALQAQETLNQRVQLKAAHLFSTEQFGTFTNFQAQQLQTLKVGMSMAKKMLSD
jgi:hypothetical protein